VAGTDERRTLEGRARAWSIVVMTLLCTVLIAVLLERPGPPPAPEQAPAAPPATNDAKAQGERYRGWLFYGWPLPQAPAQGGQPDER
jgi:hypothetical protein